MVQTLRGEKVLLRTLALDDLAELAEMLRAPVNARWWGDYDQHRLRREYIDDPEAEAFAVEVDGRLAGIVMCTEEPNPDYHYAALDITMGARYQGQGLGTDTMRTLIAHLVNERGHHRFTVDPAAENLDAIRFYEKLGFEGVGVMRRYERLSDGHWRDGRLMELIVDTDTPRQG